MPGEQLRGRWGASLGAAGVAEVGQPPLAPAGLTDAEAEDAVAWTERTGSGDPAASSQALETAVPE